MPQTRTLPTRRLGRRARIWPIVAAFVAAWLALSVASAARAQALSGPPPVFSTIDANGVNLADGSLNLSMSDVSIGQPQFGGMAFVRTWFSTGWRNNWIGTINQTGAIYTVSIGASSETFTLSGGVYTSDQGMGSTLAVNTGIYTYTLRDGTVALFDTALANGGMAFDANVGRITQLTRPNGERTTFYYKSVTAQSVTAMRLQAVANNLGYQLHLDYALDNPTLSSQLNQWKTLTQVTAINTAIDYCDPNANTCGLRAGPASPTPWRAITRPSPMLSGALLA